jgi:formylglycine-generating enzyme required for sulfatase activity
VFLAAKGTNTSGQPAVCSWNTSYYDTSVAMNPDNYPISNVDWCDANAYCAWAGKHLCGKIGGGAIAYADLFLATQHQWYLACGGPTNGTHPNNNSTCNSGTGTLAAVGTYPGCVGYYPGLYDLEGNVAEWVDGCAGNTGKGDFCYLMGGAIFDPGNSYCTEVYDDSPRNDTASSFGFRCCSG